jgi:hypothetical protein
MAGVPPIAPDMPGGTPADTGKGSLRLIVSAILPLADAAESHRRLEPRQSFEIPCSTPARKNRLERIRMPRNALEPFGTRRNGSERVGMVWNASECRRTRSERFQRAAIHSDGLKSIRMDSTQIGCAPNHSDELETIPARSERFLDVSEASGCIRIDLDCPGGKKTGRNRIEKRVTLCRGGLGMLGRSIRGMAACLAGLLALAANAQSVQEEHSSPGVGAPGGMTWEWHTDQQPGCLAGPCKGPLSAGQCGIEGVACAAGKADNPPDCTGAGCDGKLNCRPPVISGPTFSIGPPNVVGISEVRMEIYVGASWNAWARTENPTGTLSMIWSMSPTATACGKTLGTCQYVASDLTRCSIQAALGCNDAPLDFGTFSFLADVCGGGCLCEQDPQRCPCWKRTEKNGLRFVVTKEMLGCPKSQ